MSTLDDRTVVVAVRGDILGTTGYAKAARALAGILSDRYRVVGVSEQEDLDDRPLGFPGELLSWDDLPALARATRLVVVHHATPDQFRIVPNAYNVGMFYWETMAIPHRLDWPAMISAMNAIWAPTSFLRSFTLACGYTGPVATIPWPHEFGTGSERRPNGHGPDVPVEVLDRMPAPGDDQPGWTNVPFAALRREGGPLLLSVQSLAPRKGLPLLIAEWCRHLARAPGTGSRLVLKLGFRHAHGIGSDRRHHLVSLLGRYGVPAGARLRLALIDRHLDDDEMAALVGASDALVSTSLGEGFGGPIVEALVEDVPVIAPRHTGIADLLPADYALGLPSRTLCVQLREAVDLYPASSTWCVPEAGALADALAAFEAMPAGERARITAGAKAHARAFCGVEAASAAIFAEMDRVAAEHARP